LGERLAVLLRREELPPAIEARLRLLALHRRRVIRVDPRGARAERPEERRGEDARGEEARPHVLDPQRKVRLLGPLAKRGRRDDGAEAEAGARTEGATRTRRGQRCDRRSGSLAFGRGASPAWARPVRRRREQERAPQPRPRERAWARARRRKPAGKRERA